MFHLVEDLWQAQKYMQKNYDYAIPNYIFLNGQDIRWYFSSSQNNNQILRKKKDNSSVNHIIKFFGVKDLVDDLQVSFSGYQFKNQHNIDNNSYISTILKRCPTNPNNINVKHMNRSETAIFLYDFYLYPNLYKDILIYENIKADLEFGNHYIFVEMKSKYQNIELRLSGNYQSLESKIHLLEQKKINENKESRLADISRGLVLMIHKIHINKGPISNVVFYFRQAGNQFLLLCCQEIQFNNGFYGVQQFNQTTKFLHNQHLFDQFQQKTLMESIELERGNKSIKVQCASCLQICLQEETSEVLNNKISQIRTTRNLKILKSQILSSFDGYKFVRVCRVCYDVFLDNFQQKNRSIHSASLKSRNQSRNQTRMQQQSFQDINNIEHSRRKSFSVDMRYSKKDSVLCNKETTAIKKQNKQVSLMDDFEILLQELSDQTIVINNVTKESVSMQKPPLAYKQIESLRTSQMVRLPSHSQQTCESVTDKQHRSQVVYLQVQENTRLRKKQIKIHSLKQSNLSELNLDSVVSQQFNCFLSEYQSIDQSI